MIRVYFATNRKRDAAAAGGFGFDIVAEDPAQITYAAADVGGTNPADSGSGAINAFSDVSMGHFSAAASDAIAGAGNSLLVFLHGFDNSFTDAITRAAFNAAWLRASGEAAGDVTVLAFSWPSLGRLLRSGLAPPDAAYRQDQQMAGASGFHLGHFLGEIDRLRALYRARNPGGRIFLLAHSMGNWALQAAMGWWYGQHQPADGMFDAAVLAAADEVADTFLAADGSRLAHLRDIARHIDVYYSRKDAVLWLSAAVNGNARLGHDGPAGKADPARYPPDRFRLVDCTDVADFFPPVLSEETHQYYRLSPTVRTDIVSVLAGKPVPPGGLASLPPPMG